MTIFNIGTMSIQKKIDTMIAVNLQPSRSGVIIAAMIGTNINVPTAKPTEPIDIAKLLFLVNQLFKITVIGIQPPKLTPNIMIMYET